MHALTTEGVHAVLEPGELALLLIGRVTPGVVATAAEESVLAVGSPDNYVIVTVDVPGSAA